jgi:hypothetical protein
MRRCVTLCLALLCLTCLAAQEARETPSAKRYGIEPDLNAFPQKTPQATLASVLTAITRQRFDYLVAHLADPQFVDERVKRFNGSFDEVVKEITTKLTTHPETVKDLGRFLSEGEWEVRETTASAQHKDLKDRRVFLRRLQGRWFLENRQQPEAPGK